MKFTSRQSRRMYACFATLVVGMNGYTALAQTCANPTPISAGTHTLQFPTDASRENSAETWFEFEPSGIGEVVVDTLSSATPVWVEIWDGCPDSAGFELNRNHNGTNLMHRVQALLEPGRTARIRVVPLSADVSEFTLSIDEQPFDLRSPAGADVTYTEITSVMRTGVVGGIHAYSLSSNTCNIGTQNLRWQNNGTPGLAMNAYRLHNGRLVQIGMSWVKHACCAAAGNGCGMSCNGAGGSVLGVGCLDVYSASWNSGQSRLGPRSGIDAYLGTFAPLAGTTGNAIFKRLQIAQTEMGANYPGALYFVEGVYVGSDDAVSKNYLNNASHKRVTVNNTTFDMTPTGTIQSLQPAIRAWRANGGGAGVPDPRVVDGSFDVPSEGRFHTAIKVTDLGAGMWRYDYAIFNLCSDRSGGSLRIPLPQNALVVNAGFSAPLYHSGEPYDNSQWALSVTPTQISWSSPQTFAQNPNSNALRWGTMYNFWFETNKPPAAGLATLGLFKPHTPQDVDFAATVPSNPALGGDLDANGCVDAADLGILLPAWDCSGGGCMGDINGDGATNEIDLGELLRDWNGGC